jgi:hypothetical protein
MITMSVMLTAKLNSKANRRSMTGEGADEAT